MKYTFLLLALFLFTSAYAGCMHGKLEIDPVRIPDHEADPEAHLEDGRFLTTTYAGLRIYADYSRLTNASADIVSYLKDKLIPAASNYFASTLKVPKVTTLKIPQTRSTMCGFDIPSSYATTGVAADIVLFVDGETSTDAFLAWARPCALLNGTGRPIVGQIHFNFQNLIPTSDIEFTHDLLTTLHEMTHVLVFSTALYKNFVTPIVPKYKVVGGQNISYIDVAPLTKRLRTHFNCSTLVGAYLENQGGDGSVGMHFERRLFYNEYMTASDIQDARITEFTLALFEGSGWYQVNYTMAEPFTWGKNEGCGFLESCNGFSKEYCSTTADACTFTGRGGGYCSSEAFSDNCKYIKAYSNIDCEDPADEKTETIAAESYGVGSKCFMGTLYPTGTLSKARPFCFKYDCLLQKNGTYQLRAMLGSVNATCYAAGNIKVTGYKGTLTCPDPNQYCTNAGVQYCRRGCMGKGTCKSGKCVCVAGWEGYDCSKKSAASTLIASNPEVQEIDKSDFPDVEQNAPIEKKSSEIETLYENQIEIDIQIQINSHV